MVKTINVIGYKKDALRKDFIPESIPTISVKRYFRYVDGLTLDKTCGSITVSGSAALRLTRLGFAVPTISPAEFSLADKDGTFASYFCGTSAALPSQVNLSGAPNTPIHVIRPGTFNIYNAGGSSAAGTYVIFFEGIQE